MKRKSLTAVIRLKNRPLSASKSFVKIIMCVVPFLMLESFYFANFNKIRGILKGDLGLPSFFSYFKFQFRDY